MQCNHTNKGKAKWFSFKRFFLCCPSHRSFYFCHFPRTYFFPIYFHFTANFPDTYHCITPAQSFLSGFRFDMKSINLTPPTLQSSFSIRPRTLSSPIWEFGLVILQVYFLYHFAFYVLSDFTVCCVTFLTFVHLSFRSCDRALAVQNEKYFLVFVMLLNPVLPTALDPNLFALPTLLVHPVTSIPQSPNKTYRSQKKKKMQIATSKCLANGDATNSIFFLQYQSW